MCYNLCAMKVINLSSGSDGNLTYIESERSRILLDDGLSCKETEKRLSLLGVSGRDLDGIVLTHEHADHIKGVDVFSSKYNLPVFAHEDVWAGLDRKLERVPQHNRKIFLDDFAIGDMIFSPVEVPHDVKCFGFSISEGDRRLSVLTDLGHTTDQIFDAVRGSSLVYVEANHDLEMLKNCQKYPLSLKMRIAGKNGHLSNDASAQFIERLVKTGTRQVVLAHLSTENNTPDLAFEYITDVLAKHGLVEGEGFRIDVALTRPTTLFRLK